MEKWQVVGISGTGEHGEDHYTMKNNQGELTIWTPYPYNQQQKEDLLKLRNYIEKDHKLVNIEGVVNIRCIEKAPSAAVPVLYTLTDTNITHTCLADAVNNGPSNLLSSLFLWSLLRQLTAIVKRLSSNKIQHLGMKITTDNIYFDPKGTVTVSPFYLLAFTEMSNKCGNLMCDVAQVFEHILPSYNKTSKTFQDLRSVVKLISGHGKACARKPESILYHPTVLSHFRDGDIHVYENPPKMTNDSAFESDDSHIELTLSLNKSASLNDIATTPENNVSDAKKNEPFKHKGTPKKIHLSPTVLALDLNLPGYVPKKGDQVNKWRSKLELAKEPEEVTEEALNRVWLERLTALREREEAVRQKELDIQKKKIFNELSPVNVLQKSHKVDMSGVTLPTLMNHKFAPIVKTTSNKRTHSTSDASISSQNDHADSKVTHRRSSSVRRRTRKKKQMSYADMDSSLSADQGDTSVLPTSSKLTSDKVPRPTSIHHNISSRRKVHFNSNNNPFAEYDSVSSTTLTFFEIENYDKCYEVPTPLPIDAGTLADRIAKFTYLDLEEMTQKKRALLEEVRKSPPKIDRNSKPSLQSKVKTANMIRKFGGDLKNNQEIVAKNTMEIKPKLPVNKRRTICSLLIGKENVQQKKIQNDVFATPAPVKPKDKRKSILGFKTPFKFNL